MLHDKKQFLIQKEDTTNFTIIKFDNSYHVVFNKSYNQTKLSKTEIKDLQKVFLQEDTSFGLVIMALMNASKLGKAVIKKFLFHY